MAKRNMIQYNLVRNSISAYFAAIEIHNKPNIAYRYETVTLLMVNAWEEFRSIWKYTHDDVVEWCKQIISGFRQSGIFNAAKNPLWAI